MADIPTATTTTTQQLSVTDAIGLNTVSDERAVGKIDKAVRRLFGDSCIRDTDPVEYSRARLVEMVIRKREHGIQDEEAYFVCDETADFDRIITLTDSISPNYICKKRLTYFLAEMPSSFGLRDFQRIKTIAGEQFVELYLKGDRLHVVMRTTGAHIIYLRIKNADNNSAATSSSAAAIAENKQRPPSTFKRGLNWILGRPSPPAAAAAAEEGEPKRMKRGRSEDDSADEVVTSSPSAKRAKYSD